MSDRSLFAPTCLEIMGADGAEQHGTVFPQPVLHRSVNHHVCTFCTTEQVTLVLSSIPLCVIVPILSSSKMAYWQAAFRVGNVQKLFSICHLKASVKYVTTSSPLLRLALRAAGRMVWLVPLFR